MSCEECRKYDYSGMEGFSDEQREYATKVRDTVRDILSLLEPEHINTYDELLGRLKIAIEKAELDFRTNNPNKEPTTEIENELRFKRITAEVSPEFPKKEKVVPDPWPAG